MKDLFEGLGEDSIFHILNIETNYTEQSMLSLRVTTLITEEHLQDKGFKFIKSLYQEEGGPFLMALASVANALYSQGNYVFVTSRRNLWDLIKNDKNHKKPFELGWKKYGAVLSYIFETGLIRRMEPSQGKKPGIFVIQSPTFRDLVFWFIYEKEEWTWDSPDFQVFIKKQLLAVYKFRNEFKPR